MTLELEHAMATQNIFEVRVQAARQRLAVLETAQRKWRTITRGALVGAGLVVVALSILMGSGSVATFATALASVGVVVAVTLGLLRRFLLARAERHEIGHERAQLAMRGLDEKLLALQGYVDTEVRRAVEERDPLRAADYYASAALAELGIAWLVEDSETRGELLLQGATLALMGTDFRTAESILEEVPEDAVAKQRVAEMARMMSRAVDLLRTTERDGVAPELPELLARLGARERFAVASAVPRVHPPPGASGDNEPPERLEQPA